MVGNESSLSTSNSGNDTEENNTVYDTFLNPINKSGLERTKKDLKGSNRSDDGQPDVDGGWAWMVLAASFLSTTIVFGHVVNSGIYFVTFLEAFGQSRAYTAWIITVQGMAIHTTGPISSFMLSKFGPRITMMSGGLISGISLACTFLAQSIIVVTLIFAINGVGLCFLMTSSLAPMSIYFRKHFYVATGLTTSGGGLGTIVMGVQLEWAIATFGWRGSMLIQSGIMLQAVVCGALLLDVRRPTAAPPGPRSVVVNDSAVRPPDGPKFDRSLLLDPRLQIIFASFFLYFFYYNIFLLIMKDDFLSHNYVTSYETVILSLGVSNTVGRLTAGFFSEYLLVPPLQFFVASALASAALVLLIFVRTEWAYLLGFAVIGLANGQQAVLQSLTLAFFFGRPMMSVLWGCGLFLGAGAYVGGSPTAGYLVDVTGSYWSVFVMAALGSLLCGLLNLICYVIHRRRLKQEVVGEWAPLKPKNIIQKT